MNTSIIPSRVESYLNNSFLLLTNGEESRLGVRASHARGGYGCSDDLRGVAGAGGCGGCGCGGACSCDSPKAALHHMSARL